MKVINLRCEYTENTLGTDNKRPRLSWQLESKDNDAKQTAYQIVAALLLPFMGGAEGELWDTATIRASRKALPR